MNTATRTVRYGSQRGSTVGERATQETRTAPHPFITKGRLLRLADDKHVESHVVADSNIGSNTSLGFSQKMDSNVILHPDSPTEKEADASTVQGRSQRLGNTALRELSHGLCATCSVQPSGGGLLLSRTASAPNRDRVSDNSRFIARVSPSTMRLLLNEGRRTCSVTSTFRYAEEAENPTVVFGGEGRATGKG